jgi:hypothetical protein
MYWWWLLWLWLCWWYNCGNQWAHFYPPDDIWACRTIVEWYQQRKLLIRVWQSCHQSHLVADQEELGKELTNLAFEVGYLCSYFEMIFLHIVKSYDTGPRALFPFRRKASYGFYRHWKSIASGGFEPRTLIPVTSTITITPPRRRIDLLIDCKTKWDFRGLVLLKNSN